MAKVCLIGLGCPKNQVDTEIMAGLLDRAQLELIDDYSQAQVLIVNTCGFIEEAKQESIDIILQLATYKEENCQVLIVTGCLAQRYPEELEKQIPEIDGILGTGNFDQIVRVIEQGLAGESSFEVSIPEFEYNQLLPRKRLDVGYSTYLKIAEGCDNRCSYCVIPDLRGKLHSRSIEDIYSEVQELAAQGVKELNIVAQDITKYGLDLYGEPRLVELLEKLIEIEDIKWFRLLYAYPADFSEELIELIATQERICNYIDLPIQHADDQIRAQMGRQGSSQMILDLIQNLRTKIPEITIRTSLIVGFPGEGAEEFENLLSFIKQAKFDRLGVFKYSREEGTPAAEMAKQVSEEVKEERYQQVMELQQQISLARNQEWLGKEIEVLVEEVQKENGESLVSARSEGDAPEIDGLVYIKGAEAEVGDFLKVKIVDAYEYDLIGEVGPDELT